jgi:hypothetical protein
MSEATELIKYQIKYEQAEGIHTYHQCKCGRMATRAGRCVLCLQEDLIEAESTPQAGDKVDVVADARGKRKLSLRSCYQHCIEQEQENAALLKRCEDAEAAVARLKDFVRNGLLDICDSMDSVPSRGRESFHITCVREWRPKLADIVKALSQKGQSDE